MDPEIVEPASALLSVAIGTLMEDHADLAVRQLPANPGERARHFEHLRSLGRDISALADAGEVLS